MKEYFPRIIFVLLLFGYSNAQTNSSCMTPNQELGTCLPIKQCQPLVNLLLSKTRSANQTNFLRESQCGRTGQHVLICCGSVDDYRSDFNIQKMALLLPSRDICGRQTAFSCRVCLKPRILGGTDAEADEFPWMVLIGIMATPSGNWRQLCGGVLISSRYVLTAAHCFKFREKTYIVRLGEYNQNTVSDCFEESEGEVCTGPPVDIDVEEVIAHKEFFRERNRNFYHDVAVLRLVNDAPYTRFIRPICLPNGKNEYTNVGERLFISGWGASEFQGEFNYIKQKLDIPVYNFRLCSEKYRQANIYLSPRQICTGGEHHKTPCAGDSGNALMGLLPGTSDVWFAEGIVSFSRDNMCGATSWPQIYTNITDYLDWIVDHLRM